MNQPRHIGLIPDGNRTRAKKQGYEAIQGHIEGSNNAKEIIKYTFTQTKIEALTLRGLSTENTHKRPSDEVSYLMKIFMDHVIDDELNNFLIENKINYRRIGSPSGLGGDLIKAFEGKMKEHTYPDSKRTLCIAINYGGRDEITRAIQKYKNNEHKTKDITEEGIEKYLDTYGLPPVDLIIRTKSHLAKRLSGFMTRQSAYAELYFTDTLFPAFNTKELQKALDWFKNIAKDRNFGC